MSDLVIETHGLNKTFRTRQGAVRVAVRDLDLAVPGGGVHGFLGPNGSGKTTTIRMLLGLSRPTGGTMKLFGTEVPRHLPEVMPRIGAVVESPKFSPMFTGRQNLLLLARSIGEPDAPGRRGARDRRAGRPRRRPLQGLLAGHEAAARDRGDPAQGARSC